MPITHDDLRELTKVSLDDYLRNIPIDQIGVERPLLKRCLAKRKLFFGARQHIVEKVRKDYGSHFTWAYGETPVEFNKRHTTEQVRFPGDVRWMGCIWTMTAFLAQGSMYEKAHAANIG